jgi:hypothetical protein
VELSKGIRSFLPKTLHTTREAKSSPPPPKAPATKSPEQPQDNLSVQFRPTPSTEQKVESTPSEAVNPTRLKVVGPGSESISLIKAETPNFESFSYSHPKVGFTSSPAETTGTIGSTGQTFTMTGPNNTLVMGVPIDNTPDYVEKAYLTADSTLNHLNSTEAKEGSHSALLANDVNTALVEAGKATPGAWMATVGSVGGVLLVAHGVSKVVKGAGAVQKLEGVADSNWGAQTALPGVAKVAELGAWVGTATKALGVVGGAIQTGLGVKKTIDGVKNKDLEGGALGGVETVAGSSWVLASLGVCPGVTIPAFIALTVGSKAYQHRHQLKGLAKKGMTKVKHGIDKFRAPNLPPGNITTLGLADEPLRGPTIAPS